MKIKAKFKGKDGSLGYENGKTYPLIFGTVRNVVNGNLRDQIKIVRSDCSLVVGTCYYDSLKTFLNNWQVIG